MSKRFITAITYLDGTLTDFAYNTNSHSFSDLAPIDTADEKKLYTTMLLWGIKNPNVTNLAITGPYGSGKSSVIRTFQKQHPEFRTVNISLASFDEDKDKMGEWRSKVELSVIQQLIYHERSQDLPDSRFTKIRPIKWYTRIIGAIFLFFFAVSFLNVTQPEYFKRFTIVDNKLKEFLDLGFVAVLTIGCIYLLYRLYRTIRNMRFTKLSVVSAGAEFSEGETRSIFNKYLDEIIYFFEATRTRIVIIEDLDRFNDPEIFTKLREINILINNSRQISQKVTFIYAVRDNIFTKNNRTKFFDFLIPVIPIISVSNSGDALATKLHKLIPAEKMKRELLKTVTLYIQDMRMLLNIINEFSLYVKQLSKDLDPEKLLALIIFKNLHPKDFASLHRGKGIIIRVLDNKRKYVLKQKNLIDNQVVELKVKIRDLESLKIKEVAELRALYVYKALTALPAYAQLSFNGEVQPSAFLENQAFEFWRSGGALTATSYNSGFGSYRTIPFNYGFAKAEQEVNSELTYIERLEEIELYNLDGVAKAKDQIAELTRRQGILSGQSLKEIIQDGAEFEYAEDEAIPPILQYLMSNGYIDEYYHLYISYFIEGALKQADMDFVMSVLNRKPMPNDYVLSNIDVIVKDWISYGQYSNPAMLNLDLLEWLLKTPNHQREIAMVLTMIKKRGDLSFIDQFITRDRELDTLFVYLVDAWPQIWQYLDEESAYSDEVLAVYASYFIQYLPLESISENINSSSKFSKFLSYNREVYENGALITHQAKLTLVLSTIHTFLKDLSVLSELSNTLQEVYEQGLYVINEGNVRFLMEKFGGYESFPDDYWEKSNYSLVLASRADALNKNLAKNMSDYLEIVVKMASNTDENEKSLLKLLEHDELDQKKVESFMKKQKAIISDLKQVPNKYDVFLLESDKIAVNWANVLAYFCRAGGLDTPLTAYLNNTLHMDALIAEPYPLDHEATEGQVPFSEELIHRNELTFETFKNLIDHIKPNFNYLNVEVLDQNKVHYLVDVHLKFSISLYEEIAQHHPKELLLYIGKHFDEFLMAFAELAVSYQTLTDLILSERLSDQQKARLIEIILSDPTIHYEELGKTIIGFLSRYERWPDAIQQEKVFPLLKMPFATNDRVNAMLPILDSLSPSSFRNIEKTLTEPLNKVSLNDTTQRSFPRFAGLKTYVELVKKVFPDKLGKIKETADNVIVYYKADL